MVMTAWQCQLMATAQIQLYTIRVEPHSQTMTDQTRRHRVKHLAQNETAGTGDPYVGLLVIRGASARQRLQHFALRLNFLAVPQIDIACDLGDEIPILIQRLEIFRATQCQRIFDRTLQMSMRPSMAPFSCATPRLLRVARIP